MQLRQVQAHAAPWRGLREVRRRGDPVQGPARAHGPHRPRDARRAHLVFEEPAVAHRDGSRSHVEGDREDPLLRVLRRHRPEGQWPAEARAADRDQVPQGGRGARAGRFPGGDGRGSDPRDAQGDRGRVARRGAAHRDARRDQRGEAEEAGQASQGPQRAAEVGQPAGVDDPRGHSRDPARSAPARPARRRPLRDLRPERPLPSRHQPQQPVEAPDGAAGAGHHHPQREAHAAGGRRRAVRQRPSRARDHGSEQAAAEVAVRHAQGQDRPLPPEPARQARWTTRAVR